METVEPFIWNHEEPGQKKATGQLRMRTRDQELISHKGFAAVGGCVVELDSADIRKHGIAGRLQMRANDPLVAWSAVTLGDRCQAPAASHCIKNKTGTESRFDTWQVPGLEH